MCTDENELVAHLVCERPSSPCFWTLVGAIVKETWFQVGKSTKLILFCFTRKDQTDDGEQSSNMLNVGNKFGWKWF